MEQDALYASVIPAFFPVTLLLVSRQIPTLLRLIMSRALLLNSSMPSSGSLFLSSVLSCAVLNTAPIV